MGLPTDLGPVLTGCAADGISHHGAIGGGDLRTMVALSGLKHQRGTSCVGEKGRLSFLPLPQTQSLGGLTIEFETEIFISYAHIDNQPLLEGGSGWVSELQRALGVRVGQLMGKDPSIWRDQKLHGNEYFDQSILERLHHVGVLVSVLTPRYIKSESCHKELLEFCKTSEMAGRACDGYKARIFKVLKTPVAIAEHPVEIQHLLGYEFFRFDAQTGKYRELDQVFGPDAQRDFWARLDDLAQDMCALLCELESDGQGADSSGAATGKGVVYLAETSFDLKDRRDAVRRDLLAYGYSVLPDVSLPLNAPELGAYLEQALARCRLSVHLVGKSYGVVPDGTEQSLEVLQFEYANQRRDKGEFSTLIWVPPGLHVEDARQQKFVDSLRLDTRIHGGADLLETPFEELNTQIHELLEPRASPRTGSVKAQDVVEAKLSVYLICDQRDLDNISTVEDALFEQSEVFLPVFEGDEEAVREDHEATLRNCDGVLIYYGAANELWLRCKLRELLKCASGRERPLRVKGIFVAPPKSQVKEHLRTHETVVIRQTEPFASDCLAPFFAALRQEAEGLGD